MAKNASMLGRPLIIIGILLIVIGLFIAYGPRIPYLGKLPGDIYYKPAQACPRMSLSGERRFYLLLSAAASIVVSIILSVILYFINRR